MTDSFQDVYAKSLQHAHYGYPLRMPEPMSTLPPDYQEGGLQIGDVGTIDSEGQFEVLFNICKRSDNRLHDAHGVPENFLPVQPGEIKSSSNGISANPIHSHGITRIIQPNEPSPPSIYEFSSTMAGAILILPRGAISTKLLSTEQFREVAAENALDWFEFAKKRYGVRHLDRSLYLITGFYKARSWSLGSFRSPGDATGKILAKMDPKDPSIYMLESQFSSDCRHSHIDDSGSINQTVFITGFKIMDSSWLPAPMVMRVTESGTAWFTLVCLLKACLNRLRGFPGRHKPRTAISMEHSPRLSQPFHPSDVINRYLLNKNPNAKVAITHDTQWMNMMKQGLTHEDFLQEDRLETFLMRCYIVPDDSERGKTTVFLQDKVSNTMDPEVSAPSAPLTPELETSPSTTPEYQASSPPTPELELPPHPIPSLDNPRIIITRIRAQHIHYGLGRIPAGLYVLIQFNGIQQRTRNKSIRLNESGIEWEDEILLPSKSSDVVRFTVYASFELEPILGNGEALYTSESRVEELIGGTHLITFSPGKFGATVPDPSLLITMGRWYSNRLAVAPNGDSSNLNSEESSVLVRETNLGQEALLRYLNDYGREDLDHAIQCFEGAWRNCPLTHQCRAAVLVNLAKANFISYQIDPASTNLDEVISLYRQALDLCRPSRLDRPATLLQLAQTLLFAYERLRYNESVADAGEFSVADEITTLMKEVNETCHEDSYEHRAADLVLQTLKRHHVLVRAELVKLEALVSELDRSVQMPPGWHFDRPYRMINLGAALRRSFELTGDLRHLEKSILMIEEAAELIPDGHFDKPWVLFSLGDALCVRFVCSSDVADLDRSISIIEDASNFAPDSHLMIPCMAAKLGAAYLIRFVCCHASTLKMSISMTGSTVHLAPRAWLDQVNNLPVSATPAISDLADLEQAISRNRVVAELLDGNPSKPSCLANLASSLLVRFWCLGDYSDLVEAISRHRDAIMLSPDDCSDKPDYLNNLALSLRARFKHSGDLNDLEEAFLTHKDAVELMPGDHPNKASHLNNLGNCFVTRFEHFGKTSDIEEAISNLMVAVKLTPDIHPNKPSHLHNLALSFRTRFKHYGEMNDIEEAISNLANAIKLTSNDHPDKASYLSDLSLTLKAEFNHLQQLRMMGLLRAVELP